MLSFLFCNSLGPPDGLLALHWELGHLLPHWSTFIFSQVAFTPASTPSTTHSCFLPPISPTCFEHCSLIFSPTFPLSLLCYLTFVPGKLRLDNHDQSEVKIFPTWEIESCTQASLGLQGNTGLHRWAQVYHGGSPGKEFSVYSGICEILSMCVRKVSGRSTQWFREWGQMEGSVIWEVLRKLWWGILSQSVREKDLGAPQAARRARDGPSWVEGSQV